MKQRQDCLRQMDRAEKEIAQMEGKLAELEIRLNNPASHADPAESRQLAMEYEKVRTAIEVAYQTWTDLEAVVSRLE